MKLEYGELERIVKQAMQEMHPSDKANILEHLDMMLDILSDYGDTKFHALIRDLVGIVSTAQ